MVWLGAALLLVAGLVPLPASAVSVVEGSPCTTMSSLAAVRGTSYMCAMVDGRVVWKVQESTVRFGRGCTRAGEVAASGSSLFSCTSRSRVLTWKPATSGCRASYIAYVTSLSEMRAVVSQIQEIDRLTSGLSEEQRAGIERDLAEVKRLSVDVQKEVAKVRSKVTSACRT